MMAKTAPPPTPTVTLICIPLLLGELDGLEVVVELEDVGEDVPLVFVGPAPITVTVVATSRPKRTGFAPGLDEFPAQHASE